MSKCLPILDQMPPEILEKIVGYTDTFNKFRLRQCCKYFKQIVDDSEIVLQQLTFNWGYSEHWASVHVKIADHYIIKSFIASEKPVENALAALKFMEKVLKSHPKIRVSNLHFSTRFPSQELEKHSEHREIVMDEVSRVFSGLEYKLPVKTLNMELISDEQLLMSVLPHLAPGTLGELILNNLFTLDISIELPRTVETEQWKQAKALITDNCLSIDLEKTDHFKYMKYKVDRLEVEDVKRIVENILRENGWKERNICAEEYNFEAIKQYLLQFDPIIEERNYYFKLQMTIRREGYGCRIRMGIRFMMLNSC